MTINKKDEAIVKLDNDEMFNYAELRDAVKYAIDNKIEMTQHRAEVTLRVTLTYDIYDTIKDNKPIATMFHFYGKTDKLPSKGVIAVTSDTIATGLYRYLRDNVDTVAMQVLLGFFQGDTYVRPTK